MYVFLVLCFHLSFHFIVPKRILLDHNFYAFQSFTYHFMPSKQACFFVSTSSLAKYVYSFSFIRFYFSFLPPTIPPRSPALCLTVTTNRQYTKFLYYTGTSVSVISAQKGQQANRLHSDPKQRSVMVTYSFYADKPNECIDWGLLFSIMFMKIEPAIRVQITGKVVLGHIILKPCTITSADVMSLVY